MKPNLSLGFIETCPSPSSFELSGSISASINVPGFEFEISYSAKDEDDIFDYSISTAWSLDLSAQVSGAITGEGKAIKST